MKSILPLFLISLICVMTVIICTCDLDNAENNGPINQDAKSVKFSVSGITCHTCKSCIEGQLKANSGIKNVEVFLDNRTKNNVEVIFDAKKLTPADIAKMISDAGYRVDATEL
jgi:copper chaperone CopZ